MLILKTTPKTEPCGTLRVSQYILLYCCLSYFLYVLCANFQSMRWSSYPSQFELIWKVRFCQTLYWMLYQNPDDILFPSSIAFVTVPQKIINICTAQFSLHKSRLLIGHGSIIFLSALCQLPCIKLYITWDLAAGKWQDLYGTQWSAWTDCSDLHGGAVLCYESSL